MNENVRFVDEWYRTFISHSDEKDILVNKISDLIDRKKFHSCLEIGLGISPYFAEILGKHFNKYLIVEKRLYNHALPNKIGLINEDWETVKLNQKFDVIIASHVIYYFKDKKIAIQKMFKMLNPGGVIFFVVNGKSADYGPMKIAFSKMTRQPYVFTYDELMDIIGSRSYREYTVPSTIKFDHMEELYDILKISFDAWPKEYLELKDQIIRYLRSQLGSRRFIIDQKIIEVAN
jgi:SAM-dependent methyltransferase